jgi:soluble lytic murein transglycosylase-like protein
MQSRIERTAPYGTAAKAVLIAASAVLLSACSMSGIQFAAAPAQAPSPEPATMAIASLAPVSSARPGHVPPASAVPAAPAGMLGFAESGPGGLDGLIGHYSRAYNVPERLVRRVIVRESNYNPAARNGPYWGLMQIRHDTARGMGYAGSAQGLLDAETNLRYAVRYLAGAYVTSRGNEDEAYRLYASGYYYHARDRGLLQASGLR